MLSKQNTSAAINRRMSDPRFNWLDAPRGELNSRRCSLPFGSKVKVTNKKSGDTVTVTITDRGPYVKGRCIDLSKAGASALGFAGLVPVSVVPVVSD